MKNLSKLSLLVVFLSIFVSNQAFAVLSTTSTNTKGAINIKLTMVADVNVSKTKIVSQDGNLLKISFLISNGKGIQPGVKYGINLVSKTTGKEMVVDEKIYDESLLLHENQSIQKEITYVAPAFLNGTYSLYLISKNEAGFPFSSSLIGEVKLVSSVKSLEISPDSCSLTIANDKTSPTYKLNQTIKVEPNEPILITCTAINKLNTQVDAVTIFKTTQDTAFGKIVSTDNDKSTKTISFKANESKTFSTTLPMVITPGLYYLNMGLKYNDSYSNTINLPYQINGVSGKIYNFSMDKDYYVKGDIAKLSLMWNSIGDKTPISLSVNVADFKDKKCAESINQSLIKDTTKVMTEIPIPIKKNCYNPKLALVLKDSSGNILDEKSFNIETISIEKPEFNNKNIYLFILILLMIIVVGYLIYKKNKNDTPAKIFSLFIFFFIFGLMPIIKTEAATYSGWNNFGDAVWMTADDLGTYHEGDTVKINGSAGIINQGAYSATLEIAADGWPLSQPHRFLIPATSGSIDVTTTVVYSWEAQGAGTVTETNYWVISLPYTVVPDLTVTVYAQNMTVAGSQKLASALTVPYNTSVRISWVPSSSATHCNCTYLNNGVTTSCGSGVGDEVTGDTLTLAQSKTFNVRCDDLP
ncbi:MAG: hypothetical protein WCT42_04195 [Candidatus Paceibacterota bacterium]